MLKFLEIVFVFSEINLMGLSGLEKVLIFLAYNGDIHQMQAVIDLTPSYLWNITNLTFGFGLAFFIIGLGVFFLELKKRMVE